MFPLSLMLDSSQVALGATAKDNERVVIQVQSVLEDESDDDDDEKEDADGEVDGPVIVLGTLVKGKVDQVHLDHVFSGTFKLSHSGSHSVYFSGYQGFAPDEGMPGDLSLPPSASFPLTFLH